MRKHNIADCLICGTACFAHAGHDPVCVDCYVPKNPTFGWKVRLWCETKGGRISDLKKFSTTSQKENFLNKELGIVISKATKNRTGPDR